MVKQDTLLSAEDVELLLRMLFRDYRIDFTAKALCIQANWPHLDKSTYDKLMTIVNDYHLSGEGGQHETAHTNPVH